MYCVYRRVDVLRAVELTESALMLCGVVSPNDYHNEKIGRCLFRNRNVIHDMWQRLPENASAAAGLGEFCISKLPRRYNGMTLAQKEGNNVFEAF